VAKSKLEMDDIIHDILDNSAEIFAGVSVLIILLLTLYFREQYVTSILAAIAIIAIGLERRGRLFDRVVSILVVLFLAVSFNFL
jgi:lipoprotein signal peptidase